MRTHTDQRTIGWIPGWALKYRKKVGHANSYPYPQKILAVNLEENAQHVSSVGLFTLQSLLPMLYDRIHDKCQIKKFALTEEGFCDCIFHILPLDKILKTHSMPEDDWRWQKEGWQGKVRTGHQPGRPEARTFPGGL